MASQKKSRGDSRGRVMDDQRERHTPRGARARPRGWITTSPASRLFESDDRTEAPSGVSERNAPMAGPSAVESESESTGMSRERDKENREVYFKARPGFQREISWEKARGVTRRIHGAMRRRIAPSNLPTWIRHTSNHTNSEHTHTPPFYIQLKSRP